ncbi:uncharacterized protein DS421_17g589320 [Arachis hypogaea]|nr:uncharacterized protein DS421_17g589320 [Arachis hypogaea]
MMRSEEMVEQWDATQRAAKRRKQIRKCRSGEGKDTAPEERERRGGEWRRSGRWQEWRPMMVNEIVE